ncbi:MAG: Uma2 family endonuclease [Pirellulaceae bacterium]
MPLAPELVVEVVSPNDTFSQVEEKSLGWMAAGSGMVLVVDSGTRTVHVYRSSDHVVVLDERAELDAQDVVPGWTLAIAGLFD